MSRKIAATVKVTVSLEEEDVFTGDSIYKKVTPKVVVGEPKLDMDKFNLAVIKELISYKKPLKLN